MDKYYVGQTSNFTQRFEDHNSGRTVYTRVGKPRILVWEKEVSNSSEAVLLEKKIKGREAKRYLLSIGELKRPAFSAGK